MEEGQTKSLSKHGRLYISVKDSGCGISPSDQSKIFQDFCTLKSNAHLNPNGVGLGLSICKKITNLLSGDIFVESDLGKGCLFTFFVQADTSPDSRVDSNNPLPYNTSSLVPEIPSEFSMLVNRMHAIFT